MKKNILDILKEKGTGFKVPEGYLDSIESAVDLKLKENNFPLENGYTVPDNYFDTFENKVVDKLQMNSVPNGYFNTIEDNVFEKLRKEEKSKVIDFSSRIKKALIPLSVAASILFVLILTYNGDNEVSPALAQTEIDYLIDEDFITLNSYEIAEVYNDTDIDDINLNEELDLTDYVNGIDVEILMLEN